MIADVDPFSIGETNASLDRAFSSNLAKTEVDVIFYPRENLVALEFNRSLGAMYRQYWDAAARERFINSLAAYNEDFTNQRLLTNYNKTNKAYGAVNGLFEWKTLKISQTYNSSPVIDVGYRFRNNAPYFTIRQRTAREESGKNSEGIKESPTFCMYFTRAQADEIAKLFDQAFLLGSVADAIRPPEPDENRDDYYNQGSASVIQEPEEIPEPEQSAATHEQSAATHEQADTASPDNTDEAAVDFEDDLEPDV